MLDFFSQVAYSRDVPLQITFIKGIVLFCKVLKGFQVSVHNLNWCWLESGICFKLNEFMV